MDSNDYYNAFQEMFKGFGADSGFQQINPELFIITSEILGNVMAGKMPFNVQSAIGNWFELLGQVILTYNAQQQYFQGGPGRYFDYRNYNVSNPFCQQTSGTTEGNSSSGATSSEETSFNNNNYDDSNNVDISELVRKIDRLNNEIDNIKKIINKK